MRYVDVKITILPATSNMADLELSIVKALSELPTVIAVESIELK